MLQMYSMDRRYAIAEDALTVMQHYFDPITICPTISSSSERISSSCCESSRMSCSEACP